MKVVAIEQEQTSRKESSRYRTGTDQQKRNTGLHARHHLGGVLSVEKRVLARELRGAAEARVARDVDLRMDARTRA
jgi:hypothetical protein